MRITIILLLAVFSLAGCGPQMVQPSGSLAEGFIIRTVSVEPKVTITDEPFVQTPGELWAAGFAGGLGAYIAAEASAEENFIALLKAKNIDLKAMVSQSFKDQLARNSTIKLVNNQSDVKIRFQILFYGIHPSGPFSDSVEPMLEVGAEVYDKYGTHIMNLSESIKFPDDEQVKPYLMEEYLESPDLLAKSFGALSAIIANSLIQQLEYMN